MKTLITAAALVMTLTVSSGLVTPANAGPTDAPSITVQYGDLNLANKAGAEAAFARIRKAAYTVCDGFRGTDLYAREHLRSCVVESMKIAIAKVNNDNLSQIYMAKTGVAVPPKAGVLAQR